MQKGWQIAKRVVIFICLWVFFVGFLSNILFALTELWVSAETWAEIENGLNNYLHFILSVSFLISYIISPVLFKRWELNFPLKALTFTLLYLAFALFTFVFDVYFTAFDYFFELNIAELNILDLFFD